MTSKPSLKICFTSDTHGDHENIIEYCGRPWPDAKTMWSDLRANWNRKVSHDTTVWHLGDFFMSHDVDKILPKIYELRGHIRLIPGNHDDALVEYLSAQPDKMISWTYNDKPATLRLEQPLVHLNHPDVPQPLRLLHYAMEVWDDAHRGAWHLHGHTHASVPCAKRPHQALLPDGGLRGVKNRLNLCMDVFYFGQPAEKWAPVTWSELVKAMRNHNEAINK